MCGKIYNKEDLDLLDNIIKNAGKCVSADFFGKCSTCRFNYICDDFYDSVEEEHKMILKEAVKIRTLPLWLDL